MKVDRIEVPGDVSSWAHDWHAAGTYRFTAVQVEEWCKDRLPDTVPRRRFTQVAMRLADRLIQKGKKLGLWVYDGTAWNRVLGSR